MFFFSRSSDFPEILGKITVSNFTKKSKKKDKNGSYFSLDLFLGSEKTKGEKNKNVIYPSSFVREITLKNEKKQTKREEEKELKLLFL